MVKTVSLRIDPSTDRTLHIPLPADVPDGPLDVVLVIAPAEPVDGNMSLLGRWQAYFPADFDIDQALADIRTGWEKEWLADD